MMLILMFQISREEFYKFREETKTEFAKVREEMRTEFAKIYGRIDKMEGQIQALNARIDAIEKQMDSIEKQIENMREENNNKMNMLIVILGIIGTLLTAVFALLGTFLYSWFKFIREHEYKKNDRLKQKLNLITEITEKLSQKSFKIFKL